MPRIAYRFPGLGELGRLGIARLLGGGAGGRRSLQLLPQLRQLRIGLRQGHEGGRETSGGGTVPGNTKGEVVGR